MNRITIKNQKPRNPLVAHSLFRKAGAHTDAESSRRQRAGQELRQEVGALHHRTRSP